ncbi:hypothetical protein F5Y10DRAFT_248929 [Nemania abortiva]|nr:hypothetical protein F5Y10DRAFT_248929 [Nemania abortiva]
MCKTQPHRGRGAASSRSTQKFPITCSNLQESLTSLLVYHPKQDIWLQHIRAQLPDTAPNLYPSYFIGIPTHRFIMLRWNSNDNGRRVRSAVFLSQSPPPWPLRLNHRTTNSQPTFDVGYGNPENATVGDQAGPSGSQQLGFGNEHGFGQAGQIEAAIQDGWDVSNAANLGADSWIYGDSPSQINQGTSDMQHRTTVQGGRNIQPPVAQSGSTGTGLLPSPQIHRRSGILNDPAISGGIPMGQDTDIWFNPNFQRATATLPNRSIAITDDNAAGVRREDSGTGSSWNSYYGGGLVHRLQTVPARAPRRENTSLWIVKLPADCTLKDLCAGMAGCGKIFAVRIWPADVFYEYAAASVTFWDAQGANKLILKARLEQFVVKGLKPYVNRNRLAGKSLGQSHKSRVAMISGPQAIIDPKYIEDEVFKFPYELEDVVSQVNFEFWRCTQYRFSSVGQAEQAIEALRRFKKERADIHPPTMPQADWREVKIHFGYDPCEKASGYQTNRDT